MSSDSHKQLDNFSVIQVKVSRPSSMHQVPKLNYIKEPDKNQKQFLSRGNEKYRREKVTF